MNAESIQQILEMIPKEHQDKLLAVLATEPLDQAALETILQDLLDDLDATEQQQFVRKFVGQFLPLEVLVPDIYQKWRPIVRDAAIYIGQNLSSQRLIPKLAHQLTLPVETSLERRALIFIEQMPAIQKIGQIVARNRHLDPAFRAELIRLENTIQDIRPAEVFATVQQQLGGAFAEYQIDMQTVLLAEASVSAVVRFAWRNPETGQIERGVFKVLKPYVLEYLAADLDLLRGLTEYFDQNRALYQLPPAGLTEILDEVRHLLEREIDLPNEQASLVEAYVRYQQMADVRIPRLIPVLSTPYITAMSDETGTKITDALRNESRRKQRQLADRMIEVLLAVPLFAPEEQSVFHADLHAGNLAMDEQTGDLVILDWALVERLSRGQRRNFVMLFVASAWRDAERIFSAITHLSSDDLRTDEAKAALVRGHIASYLAQLPLLASPTLVRILSLLDAITSSGIRFPAELLLFRKMLFTLMDVVNEVAPGYQIDPALTRYMFTLMGKELPRRFQFPPTDTEHLFESHLTNNDLTIWAFTLPLFVNRLWLQFGEQTVNQGLERFQEISSKQAPLTPNSLLGKIQPLFTRRADAPTQATASQPSLDIPILNLSDE